MDLLISPEAELEIRRPAETDEFTGDRDLERRIANFLVERRVPGLRRLQVDAHGGVVTLQGVVGSFYQKQLCGSCSQRVAGVIRLINAIQVVPPASRFERHPD